MSSILSDRDLDMIFRAARSQNGWTSRMVSDVQIQALYELLHWGPTSANCMPARFVFVRSPEAKNTLADCVLPGNVAKVKSAPVTVIIGMDLRFYDKLDKLFPHNLDAKNWFSQDAALAQTTAFRNASLQGAYLIIAARALGLDCGPMSGFDHEKLDQAFFADTTVKSNFICGLGYGETSALYPRLPRLSFDEACRFA
jgi:3-hydroxypropanoate dehydrogenase